MVSPRKSTASIGLSQVPRKKMADDPLNRADSLYSLSSRESASLIYQSKVGMHPSALRAARQPSLLNPNSDIKQRVLSARNLRLKTFHNKLADAQHEIDNLTHENRMLRTMHKRQDSALAKYESANADLPRLLNSHAEELRVWQTKCRNLQALNKDLENKIKQKEATILSLSDQNKHYSQLNKDKNLDERQRLQEKVRTLEQRLQEKDNDMKLMARKVQLEAKNFKQQLLNEQKKTKEMMLKLEKTKLELSGYRKLEEFTLGDKTSTAITTTRRPKITTAEENDKIEKIEKSLENLEKAIEKNNQSEFNALTDGFEHNLDDFDSGSIKNTNVNVNANANIAHANVEPGSILTCADYETSKLDHSDVEKTLLSKRSSTKLTLPPAQLSKRSDKNSILGQALFNKSNENTMKSSSNRLRSGYSANKDNDNISKYSETKSLNKSIISGKSMGQKSYVLSSDLSESFDYDDDDSDFINDGGAYNDDNVPSDDHENNNNRSLINYAFMNEEQNDNHKQRYSEMIDAAEVSENDEEDDDDEHDDDSVILRTKVNTASMKEDISSIRKQISNDHKEREAFLDTFCRQTKSTNARKETPKKRNSNTPAGNQIVGNRKNTLLAALKAIDDNKGHN